MIFSEKSCIIRKKHGEGIELKPYNGKTRQTVQRRLILDVLSHAEKPLTAEEVFDLAHAQRQTIALTTVYRNLEMLEKNGIVNRNIYRDSVARFEIAAEHRHYLICKGCQKAVPLPYCPFENLERELSRETGFTIAEHRLEIFGYCSECRKK